MKITKQYSDFVIHRDDSISSAMLRITANQRRLVFVVDENGVLEGVVTDGDLRRWMTDAGSVDLNAPVSVAMNSGVVSAWATDAPKSIAAKLSTKVLAVPLVDPSSRIVGVAVHDDGSLLLGTRKIDADAPTFIIAEIGNNHNGSLEHAYHLIDLAADAGADCAKFQMRDMAAMYRKVDHSNVAKEDLGAQYTLDLLSRFQLTDSDLFKAFDHCARRGLIPLCTPWDESSLQKLDHYGMPGFKVASADFTNHDLLRAMASLAKPMLCSTGMTTESELSEGVALLADSGCSYVLLHCNSTYPTPDKDVHLNYLRHLQSLSNGVVGYSGHERGFAVPIAAVALGARVIEKHFTVDRGLEGNDHKVSLLPDEFAEMVRAIRQVELAMGSSEARTMSQGELMNREVLAKSLIAKVDIPAGEAIREDMLDTMGPGQGVQPNRKRDLIGLRLRHAKKAGEFFYSSELDVSAAVTARPYGFSNPWGIPVRYHDLQELRAMSNLDLLEIHLSYKDMDLDFRDFINAPLDLALVVHAPELFAGDHTLDLCSSDEEYRARSVREMQRVVDLTRRLADYFGTSGPVPIVTNVGGFSSAAPLPDEQRRGLYAAVEESLQRLSADGVEIIPQTMPPYPWHFGGQQFHNLFVAPDEIRDFCEETGRRVCLDVSHSKLACTQQSLSFGRFLEMVAPHTAHYHLADARGVDGEGLQIGDGDIDWIEVFGAMRKHSPAASFIPEIWQGHKNRGEGAWLALHRLEEFEREAR